MRLLNYGFAGTTCSRVLLFFALALSVFTFASASASATENVQISDTSVEEIGGVYEVSFSILNNSNSELGGVKYGVLLQGQDNSVVYEKTYDKSIAILPASKSQYNIDIPHLNISPADYTLIVTLRTQSGIILDARSAGTITIEESTVEATPLPVCTLSDVESLTFYCSGFATGNVTYKLFSKSIYGTEISAGKAVKLKSGKIQIPEQDLKPGAYEVVLQQNSSTDAPSAQSRVIFNIEGTWVAIERFALEKLDKNTFKVQVYFTGRGTSNERFFKYWILDESQEVCALDSIAFQKPYPRAHVDRVDSSGACVAPVLVGILYDGVADDGTLNIVASVGEADFTKLLADSDNHSSVKTSSSFQVANLEGSNIGYAVLGFVFLIFILYLLSRRGLLGGVLSKLFILIFSIGIANAALAWEEGDMVLIVNLDQASYLVGENITFDTITFQDTENVNHKPEGATLEVSVNGGSTYTQIISAAETAVLYSGEFAPPITSAGSHTLKFRVPELCGTFDSGMFGVGVFGMDSCTFDLPVTITAPQVSVTNFYTVADRYTPRSSTVALTWTSNNADQCSVSSVPSGYGSGTLGGNASYTTPVISAVNVSFALSCSNAYNSVSSARQITTYVCPDSYCTAGESCSVCQVDCGVCTGDSTPTLSISASPKLISVGDTTTISWSSSNVNSCSVTENNSAIADSWAAAIGSETTSTLSRSTQYTLTCQTDSGEMATSTTAHIAPTWQEI